MKTIKATILTLALVSLAACASAPSSPSEAAAPESTDSQVSTVQAEAPPVLGGNQLGDGERIVVMDTMMYRGVVSGLAQTGDGLRMQLASVPGTSFGYPSLAAVTDGTTKANFDLADLRDGMYIEAFYNDSMNGEPVTLIAVNQLPDADLCVYNGTVRSVEALDDETTQVLLEDMNGGGATTLFHIGAETSVYMDPGQIVEGAELNIFHSGATTRSLPPQGFALEVRPYSA